MAGSDDLVTEPWVLDPRSLPINIWKRDGRPSDHIVGRLFCDERITGQDFIVAQVIAWHVRRQDYSATLKRETIVRWGHLSHASRVSESSRSLEERFGVLIVDQKRTFNRYQFRPEWIAHWQPFELRGQVGGRRSRGADIALLGVRNPHTTGEPVRTNRKRVTAAAATAAREVDQQQQLIEPEGDPDPCQRQRFEQLIGAVASRARRLGRRGKHREFSFNEQAWRQRASEVGVSATLGELQERADELEEELVTRGLPVR